MLSLRELICSWMDKGRGFISTKLQKPILVLYQPVVQLFLADDKPNSHRAFTFPPTLIIVGDHEDVSFAESLLAQFFSNTFKEMRQLSFSHLSVEQLVKHRRTLQQVTVTEAIDVRCVRVVPEVGMVLDLLPGQNLFDERGSGNIDLCKRCDLLCCVHGEPFR